MNRSKSAGIGAILIASLLWGTTGTAATFAPDAGPLAIGAAALGIGGLLQGVIALGPIFRARAELRARLPLLVLGALAVAIYPLAFYASMHGAGVAVGSVISLASAPLAAGLLEFLIDRRGLGRWWMSAAVLGIAGSTLLCFSTMRDADAAGGLMLAGIGLGLLAGLTYAVYSWVVHRLMSDGIGRAAAMGSVFGSGGLLLMPVLVLTGAPLIASTGAFLVAAYMALIPMFVGYLLFGYGLARTSPGIATTVTLTEPAVAAVLAVVIVGERLGTAGWIGMGIIALALLVLGLAPSSTEPGHPAATDPRESDDGVNSWRSTHRATFPERHWNKVFGRPALSNETNGRC